MNKINLTDKLLYKIRYMSFMYLKKLINVISSSTI